ncbi:MAG: hypothetical protein DMF49_08345 [Acidobacteria bacterium]|nr:MAG: hypothetical protein DMF49_08345 [Acidobacteriota bacterium]
MPDLSRIRTILVEPQYGGNIGQCARAMLNMGLSSRSAPRGGWENIAARS